jgi:molybdate transport system ATP-binding protein
MISARIRKTSTPEGRIVLHKRALFDSAARVHLPPQRRQCGYVFQSYALFPHMTLRENLEIAAVRRPKPERRRASTKCSIVSA